MWQYFKLSNSIPAALYFLHSATLRLVDFPVRIHRSCTTSPPSPCLPANSLAKPKLVLAMILLRLRWGMQCNVCGWVWHICAHYLTASHQACAPSLRCRLLRGRLVFPFQPCPCPANLSVDLESLWARFFTIRALAATPRCPGCGRHERRERPWRRVFAWGGQFDRSAR